MIHCSATSGGSQSTVLSIPITMKKKIGLFKKWVPIIKEQRFVWGCAQSTSSSERCDNGRGAGTRQELRSHKSFRVDSFLPTKGNPLIESRNYCNKFSSLLGRSGVSRGEGKGSMSKYLFFPNVQDKEHCRTDKLATLSYLLFRFQVL